ncbi:basic 7S globulin-like [Morus notabilis]|uniref:basic 7S globulin-like n=1 Tax=Morus notabilis TaxID=981085 RepID=UPI000CED6550|nr:basic 7S globulin-like [Morus notabilis]
MASSSFHFLLFIFGSLFFSHSLAKTTSFRPKALVLPITKDTSANHIQYLTKIYQRTPLVPVKLTVDLGGDSLWLDCDKGYVSSSYKPAYCGSAPCSLAKAPCNMGMCPSDPKPGCYNNTCTLNADNNVVDLGTPGLVGSDVVSVPSTDGANRGRVVSVTKFIFTCAPAFITIGLPNGVKGIAGLGRTKISLPSQFAAAFSFRRKFAVCLSSSTKSNGVLFFGDGPYNFLPKIDVSNSLIYTPLLINPKKLPGIDIKQEPSPEYFIGVKSIKINDKSVPLNTSLLRIDRLGRGGTAISTVDAYTIMETSIYNAVVNAFVKELGNHVRRAAPVEPFRACFSSKNIGSTRVGPAVPTIDLVLQNKKVYWRIFGANSMVKVSDDVLCLGLIDSRDVVGMRHSIAIGAYQLEDHLLQFDLATSRLGFSSSLLFRQTTCSNFNFTSNA